MQKSSTLDKKLHFPSFVLLCCDAENGAVTVLKSYLVSD